MTRTAGSTTVGPGFLRYFCLFSAFRNKVAILLKLVQEPLKERLAVLRRAAGHCPLVKELRSALHLVDFLDAKQVVLVEFPFPLPGRVQFRKDFLLPIRMSLARIFSDF